MGCYILHLAINHQLLHLINTIVIIINNTNTKVISELILTDLVVLDTIIYKKNFSHIFAHLQKEYFHTYIYLITFILCNICTHFTKSFKKTFTYISSAWSLLHNMEASSNMEELLHLCFIYLRSHHQYLHKLKMHQLFETSIMWINSVCMHGKWKYISNHKTTN
jgi:hypothetical protein